MTLILAILLPLLAAAAAAARGTRPAVFVLTPWLPLVPLAAAAFPLHPVTTELMLLGLELDLDRPARWLLAGSAVIWICAGWALLRDPNGISPQRLITWHLTLAGNVGAVAAQNGTTFYLFYALLSIAVYGVVVRDHPGRTAGRLYLGVALAAELLFLAALMQVAAGTAGSATPWLMLFGLGAKLGLLPLHFPLPPAYMAAGPAGAAVFGGALTIASVAGLVRFLPPLGANPGLAQYAVAVGITTALLAALAGSLQRSPRALLGYSTISQMGIFTVGLGLLLASSHAGAGKALSFFALHHGLAKGALLLGTGARGRLAWVAMALLSLALAGAPWSGGALAKAWLEKSAEELPHIAAYLHALLPITSAATLALMTRFLWLTKNGAGDSDPGPFLLLAAAALAGPWLAAASLYENGIHELIKPFWTAAWPLGLGLAVALFVFRNAGRFRTPGLPPGDIAFFAPSAITSAGRFVARLRSPRFRPGMLIAPLRLEERLRWMGVTGLLFMVVLVGFVLLLGGLT